MPAPSSLRSLAQALDYKYPLDTFLLQDEHSERTYKRRKSRFRILQRDNDRSHYRLFLLSNKQPWQVFANGDTGDRRQRRKLVFEHSRNFPLLHLACIMGDHNHVRALLKTSRVCVLERDTCGRLALHHAVINEHHKLVKRLLRRRDAQFQVHVWDNSIRTALHYALEKLEVLALHYRTDQRAAALLTLEMRTKSKRYRRLWQCADQMLHLLNRERGLGRRSSKKESSDRLRELDMRCRGDVWDVCRSGDLERLEMIIRIYGLSKDEWALNHLERTLLHEACEHHQLRIVNFLISTRSGPLLAQDTSGSTALHCAARRGYLDVCQMLLENRNEEGLQLNEDAEELVLLQDVRGRTALHWCLLGYCDPLARLHIAAYLTRSSPTTLQICDRDGVSPLHLAIWRGERELVQTLISLGANVCASFSQVPLPRKVKEAEKAAWAPCGIVFQRRCRGHKPQTSARAEELPDSVTSGKVGPKWEEVQHPVEALWHWARQSSVRSSLSKAKNWESKREKYRDSEPFVTEEELGCRKYGGVCSRCSLSASKDSSKRASNDGDFLSPLLLALRMCALDGGNESMLDHRVAIVEQLLMSGALPDVVGGYRGGRSKHLTAPHLSALDEGFRVSLRCPRIITTLLQHGAQQVSVRSMIRYCSPASSPNAIHEMVLLQLFALQHVASSLEFLAMLFLQGYFTVLRNVVHLWSTKSQRNAPKKPGGRSSNDKPCFVHINSPWSCIYEGLMSWNSQRKKPDMERRIATKHLEFLCEAVLVDKSSDAQRDHGVWQLVEFCLDTSLHRDNACLTVSIEKTEQVLLRCIRALLKHWESDDEGEERLRSKAAAWLEATIFLGYFDCAFMLLETLDGVKEDVLLLDIVFECYSSALGARRYLGDGRLLHHCDFLVMCVEKLLNVDPTAADAMRKPRLPTVASARSVVHICANNLPLVLFKRCFETVFPECRTEKTQTVARILEMTTSIRVHGKTIVQWVLQHSRVDICQWLFNMIPDGPGRGAYWRAIVAASLWSRYGADSNTLTDKLFFFYTDYVQIHLTQSERIELLVDLMGRYAIPTDSVALFEQLVKYCKSSDLDCANPDELVHCLKRVGVLHSIARWNALQVAGFCLDGHCFDKKVQTNRIDWQQLFIDDILHCHNVDKCTPLTLCRLLGHNDLYYLLFDRIRPPKQSLMKLEAEMADKSKEIVHLRQVGLLRSVIGLNTNSKTLKTSEPFTGYRRQVRIRNPWISAVTMDQVSYLQAMSLTRLPCSNLGVSVRLIVLTAIKNASMSALKWILKANASLTERLSDEEGTECLHAAAKHPSAVYAEMTLLLLQNGLHPGRLAGDGLKVTLLHRAACFSDSSLACQIMEMLLERPDCNVNALDAFGNTAVSYALAAGCLMNACYLVQNAQCRLEAEYEGQACFYYILHMVPSFSSRKIVRHLLQAKRNRAFLHCNASNQTCGCKSFEQSRDEENNEVSSLLCRFCGHESTDHRIMPLPSWFRDQYDTYSPTATSSRQRFDVSSSKSIDSELEAFQTSFVNDNNHAVVGDEDEEFVLENSHGRLDVELLEKITVLCYDDILRANGLSFPIAFDHVDDTHASKGLITTERHCRSTSLRSTTTTPKLLPLNYVTIDTLPLFVAAGKAQDAEEWTGAIRRNGKHKKKLIGYPLWLQEELAMVHSPQCLCQVSEFVINPSQLVHIAICRWLRHVAIAHRQQPNTVVTRTESASVMALASIRSIFKHWHNVAQVDISPPLIATARPLLSTFLRSVMFQWQFGKEFQAFHRWKTSQTSAEMVHHQLAIRLEHVIADMRHHRLIALQLRQQKLQHATRRLVQSTKAHKVISTSFSSP